MKRWLFIVFSFAFAALLPFGVYHVAADYLTPYTPPICNVCKCGHVKGACADACRSGVCPVNCESKCMHVPGFCPKEPKKHPVTDGLDEDIQN
jgi:hypothetical protein